MIFVLTVVYLCQKIIGDHGRAWYYLYVDNCGPNTEASRWMIVGAAVVLYIAAPGSVHHKQVSLMVLVGGDMR